jgi:hypothetical protein
MSLPWRYGWIRGWFRTARHGHRPAARPAPYRPRLQQLEDRLAPATFTVNLTGDAPDFTPLDGRCDVDPFTPGDQVTLRAAIQCANRTAGTDYIYFSIGSGVQTIHPGSALPEVTDPVVIDGTTQPGYAASPVIELDGSGAGGAVNGLVISAGNSTVRGLVINRFSGQGIRVITNGDNWVEGNFIGTDVTGTADLGNGGIGVAAFADLNYVSRNVISGNQIGVNIAGADNRVEGNFIGTDVTGTADLGNVIAGVFVSGSGNRVGGTVRGARNLISGNGDGVSFNGSTGIGNRVEGNFIGTDVTGMRALPNSEMGVNIDLSDHVLIGGSIAAERNLISGNGQMGIFIRGTGGSASGNQILGNYIGTDVTGAFALGNGIAGVWIQNASGNSVGGPADGWRNVISGNAQYGVHIITTNHSGNNQVQGNFIGTDASGTASVRNGTGVDIIGSPNNLVGGTTPAARNVISGNGTGVQIQDFVDPTNYSAATGNLVQGNLIGASFSGNGPVGNSSHGVHITANASRNTIGGTDAGAGNVIAYNREAGVAVETGTGNAILSNSIFSNGGRLSPALGIDLKNDGVTPDDAKDPDPGPNNLQNFPVLTAASSAVATTVSGTLNSTPNTTFTLQFFASPDADPSGFGEGQRFLGQTTVTTDANGNTGFSVNFLAAVPAGQFFTATATDPGSNTSEFSQGVVVTAASANQKFVNQVYLDLLHRPADLTGLLYWTAVINTGTTREQVVLSIEASQEYRADVVQDLYQTYLHRSADAVGLSGFVNVLGQGGTDEQVAAGLIGSAEYFQNRGGGTNDGFLDALYLDALHRAVDAGARAVFDQQLAAGVSRAQVAAGILASGEYRQDLVQSFFQQFLHRTADSSTVNFFANELAQGLRDEQVIAQLVGSPEYFNRL